MVEFRGNVQTRLKKLNAGVARCTFLAMAGLNRMEYAQPDWVGLSPDIMLPAAGQRASSSSLSLTLQLEFLHLRHPDLPDQNSTQL